MIVSVIVPVFNDARRLPALFAALDRQHQRPGEVIVVDDGSTDDTPRLAEQWGARCHRLPQNRGPALARNIGAAMARGDVLAFTDSDCIPREDWTAAIARRMAAGGVQALMGKVQLPPSTALGDAISALGFPAGGSVGFENIWPVDAQGETTSLSTCNCAVRAAAFHALGGFDQRFPFPGGEDSLLAHRLVSSGGRIRYCPDMVVGHAARDDLGGFLRWQYKRGMSSYVFSRLVSDRGRYVSLRRWSTENVLRAARRDGRLMLVATLLGVAAAAQLAGYLTASRSKAIHARIDHQPAVAR